MYTRCRYGLQLPTYCDTVAHLLGRFPSLRGPVQPPLLLRRRRIHQSPTASGPGLPGLTLKLSTFSEQFVRPFRTVFSILFRRISVVAASFAFEIRLSFSCLDRVFIRRCDFVLTSDLYRSRNSNRNRRLY